MRSVGGVLVTSLIASVSTVAAGADAPIVVALPMDDTPVALFGDERMRIRERVANALSARGHDVMPIVDVVRIEQRALLGADMDGGAARCRAPLRREEIERRLGRDIRSRAWMPAAPRAFDAALDVVSRCAHPDPAVALTHEIRASVGADGRVQRCETESTSWLARAEDQRCICDSVAGLRFAAGRAGRRFRVGAHDVLGAFPPGPVRAELTTAMPGTEDWIERLRTSPALDACLAERLPATDIDTTVTLALQEDGTVADVHIGGVHQHADTVQFIACVAEELRAVPLPCRPNGQTELTTRMVVDIAALREPAMRRAFGSSITVGE